MSINAQTYADIARFHVQRMISKMQRERERERELK